MLFLKVKYHLHGIILLWSEHLLITIENHFFSCVPKGLLHAFHLIISLVLQLFSIHYTVLSAVLLLVPCNPKRYIAAQKHWSGISTYTIMQTTWTKDII